MPRSHLAALGLVSGAGLLLEIALTRLLSVALFHHFAFFVLSTALLGGGGAAVALSRCPPADPRRVAAWAAGLAGLAIPLSWWACQALGLEPLALLHAPAAWLKLGLSFGAYALPFALLATVVIALLQAAPARAGALYAADMLGAGAGALLALPALWLLPGPGVLLASAALALLAAGLLSPVRAGRALGWVGAALALGVGLRWGAQLPITITAAKTTRAGRPFQAVLADPNRTLDTRWGPLGRVDRVRFADGQARLILDAGVAAVRIPQGPPRKSDVSLPYELAPGRALIIGAGAGWEAAEALAFGATQVDAVELNPDIAAATPPDLRRDPRLRLHVQEARAFLEAPGPQYAVIEMVHTISNAATAAGALQLAEDYLLTEQALARMWARLAPGGVLLITRPEAQLARLIRTTQAALPLSEADYRAQTFAWTEPSAGLSFYAALMLKRGRFRPAERAAVRARLRHLRPLFGPDQAPTDPLYAGLLAGEPAADLEPLAGGSLRPPTDDRPFFQRRRRLTELGLDDLTALSRLARLRMALESAPLAELSILAVGLVTTLLSTLLLVSRRRRWTAGAPRPRYFFLLGLGFMLLEVPLVQQLSLLVGHPSRAFALVFCGLLVGAGLGSASLSRRPTRPRTAAWIAAAIIGAYALIGGPLRAALLSAPALPRAAAALALSGGLGLALGRPFPAGLATLDRPALAWAFGLNTVASVLGSSLALLLSPELGFNGTLGLGLGVYLLAAAAARPGPAAGEDGRPPAPQLPDRGAARPEA